MVFSIVDLGPHSDALIDQSASLLLNAFQHRTDDWQDIESARREVLDSLAPDRISRVLVDQSGIALGWIGGTPTYGGRVWEIHPLVVSESHRRRGVGRALVDDLGRIVALRGALTLWVGSDDEHNDTTLGGTDLYPDIQEKILSIRNLRHHPYEFYLRLGFRIAGVLPDANGRGKPDIFLAKRVGASAISAGPGGDCH
jgi:aminoglycoside 6'-N-acetyltransferase I